MRYDPATKVSDILKTKQARIKQAALDPGSPSWNQIQAMTWGDILDGIAQRKPGYRTIRKLLTQKDYNR